MPTLSIYVAIHTDTNKLFEDSLGSYQSLDVMTTAVRMRSEEMVTVT